MSNKNDTGTPIELLRQEVSKKASQLPPPDFAAVYRRLETRHHLNLRDLFSRRLVMPITAGALLLLLVGGIVIPGAVQRRAYRTEVESFVMSLYEDRSTMSVQVPTDPIAILFDSWNLLPVTDD